MDPNNIWLKLQHIKDTAYVGIEVTRNETNSVTKKVGLSSSISKKWLQNAEAVAFSYQEHQLLRSRVDALTPKHSHICISDYDDYSMVSYIMVIIMNISFILCAYVHGLFLSREYLDLPLDLSF